MQIAEQQRQSIIDRHHKTPKAGTHLRNEHAISNIIQYFLQIKQIS